MRALNLYTLTRIRESGEFSRLAQILSRRTWHKAFSAHEISSLCALVDKLAAEFESNRSESAGESDREDWLCRFDGFYFSYTIEHISKEFDLLKLSADGDCVLNIELKSEAIEEERIRKQLEQNRYYLSHISRTILSYTYVMETGRLYCLNDHGFLRACEMEELAQALRRPALEEFVGEDIGHWFRAQDYLISPVANPEKLLNGRYFLTNQQAEFRRQILEEFLPSGSQTEDAGVPVISLTGSAGTGKTLLLFDLALELSKKKKVLFLHGGPLREGHRIINRRLHKVTILSGTEVTSLHPDPAGHAEAGSGRRGVFPDIFIRAHDFILIDEANRLSDEALQSVMRQAGTFRIPCILSYDPHSILGQIPAMENAEALIAEHETLRLELSGNIRINRPIFSFLRTLFHQKDRSGHVDYDCIDVLYAGNRQEEKLLTKHYLGMGYVLIDISDTKEDIISREYDKVLMILDKRFYYDESRHLCADGTKGAAISPLYEGLSRARERLCLLVLENKDLFTQILSIREEESQ